MIYKKIIIIVEGVHAWCALPVFQFVNTLSEVELESPPFTAISTWLKILSNQVLCDLSFLKETIALCRDHLFYIP